MGEEEVIALAHSLKNVIQLSKLHLSSNPLGHGISELVKHLHNVPRLKKLYLNDTQMSEEEVTALARVLVYVPELIFLVLDGNPLGRGVTELIKCLRCGRPLLSKLLLSQVQLTKKEATELCTLANEGPIDLVSRYVSYYFVICTNNTRNTQELPGRREGTVLQRGCVTILIHIKNDTFCKRKLVE